MTDGEGDGEDEVEEEDGEDEEVHGWVETGVILEVLFGWHGLFLSGAENF